MIRTICFLMSIGWFASLAARTAGAQNSEMTGRCGRDVAFLILNRFGVEASLGEVTEAIGDEPTIEFSGLQAFLKTKGLDAQAKWLPIETAPKLGQWMQESRRQLAVVLVLPAIESGQPHHAVLMAHSGEEGFETIEPGTDALRRYEWKTFQDSGPLPVLWVTGDAYRIGAGASGGTQVASWTVPRSSGLLALLAVLGITIVYAPRWYQKLSPFQRPADDGDATGRVLSRRWLPGRQAGLVLVIPLAMLFGYFAPSWDSATSDIQLSTNQVDLGEIPLTDTRMAKVTVTNWEDRPVKIARVKTTCSCLAAKDNLTLLPPGESVEMKFELHANGVGVVQQTIELITEPKSSQPLVVDFRYTGMPVATLAPRQTTVGTILLGDPPDVPADDPRRTGEGELVFQIRDYLDAPREVVLESQDEGPLTFRLAKDQQWRPEGTIELLYSTDLTTEQRGSFHQELVLGCGSEAGENAARQRVRVYGHISHHRADLTSEATRLNLDDES